MSTYQNMSLEQQQYTQVSSINNKLYQARKFSMELQVAALSPDSDPLVIAQKANELGRMIEAGAKQLYALKMSIEEQHPEFKTQAQEYAKSMQQQKTVQVEQSL